MKPAAATSAALLVLVLAGPGVAGPFEDGVAAYDQGRFSDASALWRPLAEQGHRGAQFNLAVLYESGQGVARDDAEAARWFLEAAKQGDPEAQYKVGLLHETGTGLPTDTAAARRWYEQLIASPGSDAASVAAKRLARERLASLLNITQDVIAYDGGRFVVVRSPGSGCVIAIQGMITLDANRKFDDAAMRARELGCDRPWVMLESPGGGLFDGIRLGREVRDQGYRTITRYECASACAIIFLGGHERVLAGSRAKIGFHQPAWTGSDGSDRRCAKLDRSTVSQMRSVFPDDADQLIQLFAQTDCDSINWIGGQRALELRVATRLDSANADLFGPKSERSK